MSCGVAGIIKTLLLILCLPLWVSIFFFLEVVIRPLLLFIKVLKNNCSNPLKLILVFILGLILLPVVVIVFFFWAFYQGILNAVEFVLTSDFGKALAGLFWEKDNAIEKRLLLVIAYFGGGYSLF